MLHEPNRVRDPVLVDLRENMREGLAVMQGMPGHSRGKKEGQYRGNMEKHTYSRFYPQNAINHNFTVQLAYVTIIFALSANK